MFTANTVKNATYQTFGPYLVAAAIYFIITSILSLLVKRLEKKLTKQVKKLLLEIKDLHKKFGKLEVLKGVNISVEKGRKS